MKGRPDSPVFDLTYRLERARVAAHLRALADQLDDDQGPRVRDAQFEIGTDRRAPDLLAGDVTAPPHVAHVGRLMEDLEATTAHYAIRWDGYGPGRFAFPDAPGRCTARERASVVTAGEPVEWPPRCIGNADHQGVYHLHVDPATFGMTYWTDLRAEELHGGWPL